jgi:hypothetical protein
MMMRAQTNIKTAVNRPLRERLGSLIPEQSLAGGIRNRYRTPVTAYTRVTSLFIRCASRPPVYPPLTRPRLSYCASENRVVRSHSQTAVTVLPIPLARRAPLPLAPPCNRQRLFFSLATGRIFRLLRQRTIHPQVDAQSVIMLLSPHAIRNQKNKGGGHGDRWD